MPAVPGFQAQPGVAPGFNRPGLRLQPRFNTVGGPQPIRRYWVGGGSAATWAATGPTNWATQSGGPNNASVPNNTMEVFFDENSGTGTCTVGATAPCLSLDLDGVSPLFTFAGTAILTIGGATNPTRGVALRCGGNWTHTGAITFASSAPQQLAIVTRGKTTGSWTFNGAGGSWIARDNFTLTSALTLTRGTFSDGGVTWQATTLSSPSAAQIRGLFISGTATLTLTSTPINIVDGGTLTYSFADSSLTCLQLGSTATWATGSLTYNDVTLRGTNIQLNAVSGSPTFRNLTVISVTGAVNEKWFQVAGTTITVTGTFTWNGTNPERFRPLFASLTPGTPFTLDAANIAVSNLDFSDVIAAGAAAPFTGSSLGDFMGNSNITFPVSVTNYWVGGAANWEDTTHWANASGGVGGTGRVPLPHDDCVVDAASGSGTIAIRQARLGRNINLTDAPFSSVISPTQSILGLGYSIAGNFAHPANGAWNQGVSNSPNTDWRLRGRGSHTLTLNGRLWNHNIVELVTPTGTYTLQDSGGVVGLVLTQGTFDVVPTPVTFSAVTIASTGATWNARSSTWVVAQSITFGGTFIPGTSILELNGTSAGLNNNTGSTVTVWDVHVTGVQGYFLGNDNFIVHDLTVVAGARVGSFVGRTTTFSNIFVNGTSGSHCEISNTSQFTWSCDGTVAVNYADVDHVTAAGASIPFHSVNGVDNGNNVNWLFDQNLSATDTIDLVDSETSDLTRNAFVTDLIGIVDATTKSLGTTVTDNLGLTDTPTAAVIYLLTVTDSSGLTDTVVPIWISVLPAPVTLELLINEPHVFSTLTVRPSVVDLDLVINALRRVLIGTIGHARFSSITAATGRLQILTTAGRIQTLAFGPAVGEINIAVEVTDTFSRPDADTLGTTSDRKHNWAPGLFFHPSAPYVELIILDNIGSTPSPPGRGMNVIDISGLRQASSTYYVEAELWASPDVSILLYATQINQWQEAGAGVVVGPGGGHFASVWAYSDFDGEIGDTYPVTPDTWVTVRIDIDQTAATMTVTVDGVESWTGTPETGTLNGQYLAVRAFTHIFGSTGTPVIRNLHAFHD